VLLELFRSSLLLNRLVTQELAALGLRAELFGLLTLIRAVGPITPTALAAETGIALTTLSDHVQTLVDRGHVRRDPNPRDRRSYLVTLTPAGKKFLTAASPALRRTNRLLETNLDRPIGELEDVVGDLNVALHRALSASNVAGVR
jgi:DNA-binding MarR family transcriptional regulator